MTATSHISSVRNSPSRALAPLRVTLVADDEVNTRGLGSMLSEHRERFEFVPIAARGVAPIDVALYDPAPGDHSRLERLERLLSDPLVRKVAVFTSDFEPSRAREFIGRGACAYLSKRMASAEIVDALTTVATGEVVVPDTNNSDSVPSLVTPHGQTLTSREIQVLNHVASGFSNKEIARKLYLSDNTVKSYVRSSYRKIDVDSRSKAVLWALTHGLGDARRPDRME